MRETTGFESGHFSQDSPPLSESHPKKDGHDIFEDPHLQVVIDYMTAHPRFRLQCQPTHSQWLSPRSLTPEASVGVVHDIDDDSYMLIDTLQQLQASSIKEKDKLEVHVGFNADTPDLFVGENTRTQKFECLTNFLRGVQPQLFPELRLHVFLIHVPNRNMNKVWNALFEVMAGFAVWHPSHRDAAYPVIRLDSDSKGLTPEALPEMIHAVRGNKAHLIKWPTSFQNHEHDSSPNGYSPLDFLTTRERMAHAVTHMYAVTKDLIDAQLGATEHRTYDEESGSGAQLITWMQVLAYQRLEDPEQVSNEGETKAFKRIAKSVLSNDIPTILYLDREAALHHTSHRRIFLQALRRPAWQVPLQEDGSDYLPYANMQDSKNDFFEVQNQTREYAMAMIGILLLRQERISGREIILPQHQQDQLAELVNDPLFQHNGQPLGSDWIMEAKRLGAARLMY